MLGLWNKKNFSSKLLDKEFFNLYRENQLDL